MCHFISSNYFLKVPISKTTPKKKEEAESSEDEIKAEIDEEDSYSPSSSPLPPSSPPSSPLRPTSPPKQEAFLDFDIKQSLSPLNENYEDDNDIIMDVDDSHSFHDNDDELLPSSPLMTSPTPIKEQKSISPNKQEEYLSKELEPVSFTKEESTTTPAIIPQLTPTKESASQLLQPKTSPEIVKPPPISGTFSEKDKIVPKTLSVPLPNDLKPENTLAKIPSPPKLTEIQPPSFNPPPPINSLPRSTIVNHTSVQESHTKEKSLVDNMESKNADLTLKSALTNPYAQQLLANMYQLSGNAAANSAFYAAKELLINFYFVGHSRFCEL